MTLVGKFICKQVLNCTAYIKLQCQKFQYRHYINKVPYNSTQGLKRTNITRKVLDR